MLLYSILIFSYTVLEVGKTSNQCEKGQKYLKSDFEI